MASLGSALLGLMGTKDPRQQLAATLLQGGRAPGTTPAGAAPAPGTTPAPGAPPAPAGPAQPEVYQSPPQLLELFSSLQEYSNKSSSIDKGIGMLGAAFAQEGNRDDILSAYSGTPSDPNADLGLLMQMQEQQAALAEKSQARQQALAAAEKLGIDPATAAYLDQSGELGEYIAEALKPKTVTTDVLKRADGSQALIDKATGEILRELSPAEIKERETEVVGGDSSGRFLIDSNTGERLRKVTKPVANTGITYRRMTPEEVAAYPNLDKSKEYEVGSNGNVQAIGGGGVEINLGGDMNDVDEKLLQGVDDELVNKSYPAAQAAVSTIASVGQARGAFESEGGIITGSVWAPFENETRKVLSDVFGIEDPATANTAQFEAAQADVVRSKIKELGTGNAISNADLTFTLNSIGAGGQIPEEAIPEIFKVMEIGSYNTVLKHNNAIDAAIEGRKAQAAASGGTVRTDVIAALEAKKLPVPEISIPSAAIADLKADPSPEARAEFEEVFGKGMAAHILMVQ